MKNNNRSIIRRITGRALRTDIKRNFFITVAITLTAFMIASVFSVGMGFYESTVIMPFRLEGTRAHIGFMGLDGEQTEKLYNLNYVRHVGHATPVVDPVGHILADSPMTMVYICPVNWQHFATPAYTNVVGRYATAVNEIMLSRAKLARMGIDNPYVGMELPLDFTIHGSEEVRHKTFILSAFYTEFISVSPRGFTPVLISQAFAEQHGRYTPYNASITVLFRSVHRAYEYGRRLLQDLNLREGQVYEMHPAVLRGVNVNFNIMFTSIAVIVAFLMLVGFLLIYNVMFVSVSKDVRFYGLLKTLGTTPRQLRRIVNGQVLLLYVIGLPLGLGAAALASLVLVPAFISMSTGTIVSFSPAIYVGSAVFTLLTAYLGAFTSARKAARVSPIEAVRYTGTVEAAFSRPRRSARGKPRLMAWRNVFRGRKQAAIVLLSLFLGITVFTTAMTVVFGFDIESSLEDMHTHDFEIGGGTHEGRGFAGFLYPGLADGLLATPNVTCVHRQHLAQGRIAELRTFGGITGIDTPVLLELYPYVDIAAFERGEIALFDNDRFPLRCPEGHAANAHMHIGMTVDIEIGRNETFTQTVQIAGMLPRNLPGASSSGMGYLPMALTMSNVFLEQHLCAHADDMLLTRLGVNVQPGTDSQAYADLLGAIAGRASITGSRYQSRRALEDARFTIFVLGVGISAILGMIGIFNFINVITVGLLVRKREFAALESVGMSKTQMRAMLRWEGAVYWMLTIAASLTAGTAIAIGIFRLISSADPAQFPQFNYPVTATAVAYVLIIAICSVVPEAAYKSMSKLTLVERLREGE